MMRSGHFFGDCRKAEQRYWIYRTYHTERDVWMADVGLTLQIDWDLVVVNGN
jgi:hypothetical protein